jgi:4-hydroxybenzoate polyprenyltransferase
LRPRQWAKNLLVFAGLIFGQQLHNRDAVLQSAGAFAAFCLLSSAVYLINDVIDRETDRYHPIKALRPVASGKLSVRHALAAAVCLIAAGLALAITLDHTFALIAVAYLMSMGLYVGALKHVMIVDTVIISAGFVLRAWGGAVVVHVPASGWLLLVTLLLAMFLSLSKRRAELSLLLEQAGNHRQAYGRSALLDWLIGLVTAATLVTYALYTVSNETVTRFGTRQLLLTVPLPILGMLRYLYLVYRGRGGSDPSEHLLSDVPLLACVVLWAVAVVAIIGCPQPR